MVRDLCQPKGAPVGWLSCLRSRGGGAELVTCRFTSVGHPPWGLAVTVTLGRAAMGIERRGG